MPASPLNSDDNEKQEKFNLINDLAPQILKLLRNEVSALKPAELDILSGLAQTEKKSEVLIGDLNKNLKEFMSCFKNIFEGEIPNISTEEKKKVNEIYNETILTSVAHAIANTDLVPDANVGAGKKASPELDAKIIDEINIDEINPEGTKKTLYSYILPEEISHIVDNILLFKNKIDEYFPGLTETVFATAATAIVGLVASYSPSLAMLLGSAAMLIPAVKLLSETIDFEKIFSKISQTIQEIRNDRELNKLHEAGIETAEIARELGTDPATVGKFNLSPASVKETLQEIASKEPVKKLMTEVADFAKKNIPNNMQDFTDKIASLKTDIATKLEKAGIPKEIIKSTGEIVDKVMGDARLNVNKAFSAGAKVFDKVSTMIQSNKALEKIGTDIAKLVPVGSPHVATLKNVAKEFSDKAVKVNENAGKIAGALKNRDVKKFADTVLGMGFSNKVVLDQVVSKAVNLARQ